MIDSLRFEKANIDDLDLNIQTQIRDYVPVMSAPALAKELLIQHISVLSKSKIIKLDFYKMGFINSVLRKVFLKKIEEQK